MPKLIEYLESKHYFTSKIVKLQRQVYSLLYNKSDFFLKLQGLTYLLGNNRKLHTHISQRVPHQRLVLPKINKCCMKKKKKHFVIIYIHILGWVKYN